ncbi:glutamate racemase [Patescibacteria group bacterium]|nr:glutamate racemase [Patescibacteria group bacterium]MBU1727901.1 glutamate racemase [Patescibacteria group bacterium]
MKIGIFDSGLGGLIVTRAIRKAMPLYDYVYLGDTKRVPYGNRSYETVFEFTRQAVDYLFKKENCEIIILACNTASARALRRIQQEYLLKNFPKRKVLGVLIPTAEECAKYKKVGVIGTAGTVASNTFVDEIKKLNKKVAVFQEPTPMLVPLVEEGEKVLAKPFLLKYLKSFLNKKFDAVALGCTHYPIFKSEIRKILGKKIKVLSQDEIIPKELKEYFARHPEIEKKLSKNKSAKILVTDMTKNVMKLTQKWFGKNSKPELIKL